MPFGTPIDCGWLVVASQKPILLKGHERSITHVDYNREGDLLFTCAKDGLITVWWSHNGERIGTYRGHNGAVYQVHVDRASTKLLSAGTDQHVKLWRLESGEEAFSWTLEGPARSVSWSDSESMFAVANAAFGAKPVALNIFDYTGDPATQPSEPRLRIISKKNPKTTIIRVSWLRLDEGVIAAYEDGEIAVFDPETGEEVRRIQAHRGPVMCLSFNKEKTFLLSASQDNTAKLWDARTFEHLKTYRANTGLNAAAFAPNKEHVFLGGGQEAGQVTTTAVGAGNFETRIHHLVFENELAKISGHFGPINTMAVHPDGRSFVSGAEDGYIRIHHLPEDYFTLGAEPELDEPEVVAATEAREDAKARGADDDEVEHAMQQAWDRVVDERRLAAMGHADAAGGGAGGADGRTNQANAGSGARQAAR